MQCWKCGTNLPEFSRGKVPFRELCDKCSSWLHCCKNCHNYKPGKPNDCIVPGTELISDRESCNFCEEFQLLGKPPSEERNNSKSKFNDLFRD